MSLRTTLFACLITAFSSASCTRSSFSPPPPAMPRPPDAKMLVDWRAQNGLSLASAADIEAAGRMEASFNGHNARSADAKLHLAFRPGRLIGAGSSNLSTAAAYSLRDANGKELVSAPSFCADEFLKDNPKAAHRQAWFAPDGKRVVVYEYMAMCNGPGPLVIEFRVDEDGYWRTRFPSLPQCNLIFIDEAAHASCEGFVGDELLIDPADGQGTLCKQKIAEMKQDYPFPFTIG